jgi:hypothetical protein
VNELPLPLVEFIASYHSGSIAAERLIIVFRLALVLLATAVRLASEYQERVHRVRCL